MDPSPDQLKSLYKKIDYFIIKNAKISKDKLYASPESGGLGLIDVQNYLIALRVGIFKRSISSNDHWAKSIKEARLIPDHPFILNSSNEWLSRNPFSKLIVTNFQKWAGSLAKTKNNFQTYPIFYNKWAFSN